MFRLNMNLPRHSVEKTARVRVGLMNAANKGMTASTGRTPFKGGQLRQDRRVSPLPNGARMTWSAPYAAVHNLGQRRGARPFTNYTTPGTGKGFVEEAIKVVRSEISTLR